MKRRPLLLAVVLTVAAVACIAPFWWEIWFAVAYENMHAPDGLAYYQKRTAWLPGQPVAVPDQPCPNCRTGTAHSPLNWQSLILQSQPDLLTRLSTRCVCA